MERPFSDQRILGPFAQSSSSGLNFVSTYKADIDELDGLMDDLADNIETNIGNAYSSPSSINTVSVSASPAGNKITVRVNTSFDEIESKDEDILIDVIETEIQRLSGEPTKNVSYKFQV